MTVVKHCVFPVTIDRYISALRQHDKLRCGRYSR